MTVWNCCRFEIEKKLKKAKREQRKSKPPPQSQTPSQSQPPPAAASDAVSVATISERSKERRKNIEDRKDSKKTSAFQDLKARREEKLKKGKLNLQRELCVLVSQSIAVLC